MENNAVKKDNRKALPKYLLILLAAAIFGGFMGFAAGWVSHDNISEVIAAAVADGLTAAAPWALLVTSVVSLGLILWLYRSAKALFTGWDGEDDATMDRADEKLNWALLLTAAQLVLETDYRIKTSYDDPQRLLELLLLSLAREAQNG